MSSGFGLWKQAGAMLCVALTLVFTQAAVASAVGDVEHLVVGHHEHHHVLFSDITLDFGHHGDHHALNDHHDLNDDAAPGHAPSHHHHHGDLGSSSFLIASNPETLTGRVGSIETPALSLKLDRTRLPLPERPPRIGNIRL